jgi:hypothetical protein
LSRRYKNTYEPASCLVGWEARLREIDAKYEKASTLPAVNPFKITHAAREVAAKRKSDELAQKRGRLKELQQRHSAATSVDEPDKADEETIAPDHVDEETPHGVHINRCSSCSRCAVWASQCVNDLLRVEDQRPSRTDTVFRSVW